MLSGVYEAVLLIGPCVLQGLKPQVSSMVAEMIERPISLRPPDVIAGNLCDMSASAVNRRISQLALPNSYI